MNIARTDAMPVEGMIPAWDAGWNAHTVGLDRETVAVLTPPSGREWALLGYDCRQLLDERKNCDILEP